MRNYLNLLLVANCLMGQILKITPRLVYLSDTLCPFQDNIADKKTPWGSASSFCKCTDIIFEQKSSNRQLGLERPGSHLHRKAFWCFQPKYSVCLACFTRDEHTYDCLGNRSVPGAKASG